MKYLYRRFPSEGMEDIRALLRRTFTGSMYPNDWTWKYESCPPPSPLLSVVELDGRVVGFCAHHERTLHFASNRRVNCITLSDVAVDAPKRGAGLARQMLLKTMAEGLSPQERRSVGVLWAHPALSRRLYTPFLGYVPTPTTNRYYGRVFDWNGALELHRGEDKEGEPTAASRTVARAEVRGLSPLTIIADRDRLSFTKECTRNPDVILRIDPRIFGFWAGPRTPWLFRLTVALLRGWVLCSMSLTAWPGLIRNSRGLFRGLLLVLRGPT